MLSAKQCIYSDIFGFILCFSRNIQTWPIRKRIFINLHPELELVYDLFYLFENDGFTESDVRWINNQGRMYADSYASGCAFLGMSVLPKICELIDLIPCELLHLLTVDKKKFEIHGS